MGRQRHIGTFIIVSGDSDFMPMAQKVKVGARAGRHRRAPFTNRHWASSCHDFHYYENLLQNAEGAVATQLRAAACRCGGADPARHAAADRTPGRGVRACRRCSRWPSGWIRPSMPGTMAAPTLQPCFSRWMPWWKPLMAQARSACVCADA